MGQSSRTLPILFLFFLFVCLAVATPSSSSSSSFYDFIFLRFVSAPRADSSPPPAPSIQRRQPNGWPEGAGCNCTSGQPCCYWSDLPFCCDESSSCCGSVCCPAGGICCRSRRWPGVSSCCSSYQYCTASGECAVLPNVNNADWSLLPLMIGSFVTVFVVCCFTGVCISRMNRRRAVLAAAATNPALLGHNNPSTNSLYRTFQPRGSYSAHGVSTSTLRSFPTKSYHPGCMPQENAQCSICLLEYETGERFRTLPCNHHFHQACIDRWLSEHDTCPLCVQVVTLRVSSATAVATDHC